MRAAQGDTCGPARRVGRVLWALRRLLLGLARRGALLRHPRLKRALASAYASINGGLREEMDTATATHLEKLYEPSNREVAAMLGEHGYGDSLPAWLRMRGVAGRAPEPSARG